MFRQEVVYHRLLLVGSFFATIIDDMGKQEQNERAVTARKVIAAKLYQGEHLTSNDFVEVFEEHGLSLGAAQRVGVEMRTGRFTRDTGILIQVTQKKTNRRPIFVYSKKGRS